MTGFDVIVLGAGIVGSACAMECVRAGLRVAVVERDAALSGATAAGMGHVVAMDGSPAQLALTNYSRSLWRELAPDLPANVEFEPRGTVWVAADDEEMREVHAKHATFAAARIESEVLDSRELAEAEPNLRPGLAGGLLVPDDCVLYPPAAAQFFLREAIRGGAILLCDQAAERIANGRVTLKDGSSYSADKIVVATGVETHLLPWLPIQKRKGHLIITRPYPGFLHRQLVELGYTRSAHSITTDSVAFNIQPRPNGQIIIGSSRQYLSQEEGVEPKVLERMLQRAQSYMPALAEMPGIRSWAGFRAATPDNLPLIGATSDPGIFLAVGFEGLGITSAPAAARLLVDALLGRVSEIDRTPFLPSRVAQAAATS
jgi:glycine/D-amino acid oxidase-like deaminating enzyme